MLLMLLATAVDARGQQQTFDFDWRVAVTVTRWTGPADGEPGETTVTTERRGRAVLSLLPSPDGAAVYAIDFRGPEGAGTGLALRGQRLDPNLALPAPLAAGLPAADPRTVGGTWRTLGNPRDPSGIELRFAAAFVCRSTRSACGDIARWELTLAGSGPRAPDRPPPSVPGR